MKITVTERNNVGNVKFSGIAQVSGLGVLEAQINTASNLAASASNTANDAANSAAAAYSAANNAVIVGSIGLLAYSRANAFSIFANSGLIQSNTHNLSFQNTGTINVSATANTTNGVNLRFSVNTSAITSGGVANVSSGNTSNVVITGNSTNVIIDTRATGGGGGGGIPFVRLNFSDSGDQTYQDWNPAGFDSTITDIYMLNGNNSDFTIGGIVGGTDGRRLRIWNVSAGGHTILSNNNGGSSAGNKMSIGGGLSVMSIRGGQGLEIQYNASLNGGVWVALWGTSDP